MILCFPQEKGGENQLELKAWNSVTKHELSRIGGWKGFTTAFCTRWNRCLSVSSPHGLQISRISRTGSGTWKKIPGCDRNSGAGLVFEFEECCPCCEKETVTEQALPPALSLEIRRPPNAQCKLGRCSIQSELRPVPPGCRVFIWIFWSPLCYSISLQIWYLDFCPWWWILPPQYWRRHHSSGPLWSRRRIQRIMMWPSPPLPSCSTQIQHSLL